MPISTGDHKKTKAIDINTINFEKLNTEDRSSRRISHISTSYDSWKSDGADSLFTLILDKTSNLFRAPTLILAKDFEGRAYFVIICDSSRETGSLAASGLGHPFGIFIPKLLEYLSN